MKSLHNVGQLILRVGVSALMMTHGWPKLQKLMAGGEIEFFDFMWLGPTISLFLAVVGEFFAPLLIIVGYQTRWAAFVAAFTMGVAAFYVHSGDPLGDKEAALMYFIGFLAIALIDQSKWSIDRKTNGN
jgi:putative oxidoreductase